jgi:hypothetical protein
MLSLPCRAPAPAVQQGFDFRSTGRKARKNFFFEKKKQKTFTICGQQAVQIGQPDAARNRQKFFGSFFQKRTASFSCLLP